MKSTTFGLYGFLAITCFNFANASKTPIPDKKDGEYVSISGKAKNVKARSFNLNVDGKSVLVELDDYGWDGDGYKLRNGDQVAVFGRVDQDFLESKKIEASSVFVKNLNTYFFANSADEEDYPLLTPAYMGLRAFPEDARVHLRGKVTEVNGAEFVVDTGLRKVTVDTGELAFNPMDNKGYTKINLGDRVWVVGEVAHDFFEGMEIKAMQVAEIKK